VEVRQRAPLPVYRQDRRRFDSARVHRADRSGIREALDNGILAGFTMVDVAAF